LASIAEIGAELEKKFVQLVYSTVLFEMSGGLFAISYLKKGAPMHFILVTCKNIAMMHC